MSAVFADGYQSGDADEAVQLWNVGPVAADLAGWSVADATGRAAFPPGAVLPAGARWWLAREGEAFARSFGQPADWTWSGAAGPGGPTRRLTTLGGGPSLANGGDAVRLVAADGAVVDVVVYGDAQAPADGWRGPAVVPYSWGRVGASNQVLYRKIDPTSGRTFADTGAAADWAADPADAAHGRRVRFPGWRLEARPRPRAVTETARIDVAVAPDGLYGFLARHLGAARRTVDLTAYTFDNPGMADVLAERARAGVRVRVLLDGAPAGGITPGERWGLARIAAAGGAVFWHDDGGEVGRRYRALHGKVAVIDNTEVLLGSENPGLGAAPNDDPADGTAGRRGVALATDAPGVVAWAREVLAEDLDPAYADVRPFQPRDPARGAPLPDFVPDRAGGGAGYWPVAPLPLATRGTFRFELISAPENALVPDAGLLGLLARAGAGDEVLVEQLDEPVWWGAGPVAGPEALNPRVQAYLGAARRGARVRVLLDAYFDDPADPRGNAATVQYLVEAARAEGLDLQARRGNPARLGLHNKMALVHLGGAAAVAGERWTHVGSLNGSESAHKANRELALQVESAAMHAYLSAVFRWDWVASGTNAVYVPAADRP